MNTDSGDGTRPEWQWNKVLENEDEVVDNGDIAGAKEIIKKYKTDKTEKKFSGTDPGITRPW